MKTTELSNLKGVEVVRPVNSGGSIRDMEFLGRGYYDQAKNPSVFSMGHELGALQFRIERQSGQKPRVRVHDENLHHSAPGLSAKLPVLVREEITQLREALEASKPVGGLQKSDRTRLQAELTKVLQETDTPNNTKPKQPRSVEALLGSVEEAWQKINDDVGPPSRPHLGSRSKLVRDEFDDGRGRPPSLLDDLRSTPRPRR